ncbi:MAG: putative metal-binding protein (TIGR02443 family) [Cellvibrionaceae bacterium]|jgi:uncharacterized metal-binding protein (TIGR02443 family)
MTEKIVKRFIAGAVCPRCAEMDKLMMYKRDGKDFRECVNCDFADEMRFANTRQELQTRVSASEETKREQTQVLTLEPSSFNKK